MSVDAVLRHVAALGDTAGAAVVANAGNLIAARVAAAFPDIAVTTEDQAVVLQAPGLVARAFGTRHRAADPRLSSLESIVSGGGA